MILTGLHGYSITPPAWIPNLVLDEKDAQVSWHPSPARRLTHKTSRTLLSWSFEHDYVRVLEGSILQGNESAQDGYNG